MFMTKPGSTSLQRMAAGLENNIEIDHYSEKTQVQVFTIGRTFYSYTIFVLGSFQILYQKQKMKEERFFMVIN